VCIGTLQPQQRCLADISRKVDVDKDSDTSEEYCHGSIENKTVVLTHTEPQQNLSKPDEFKEHPSQERNGLPKLYLKDSECSQDFRSQPITTVTQTTVARTDNLMFVQNSEIITVMARYKEDILRFRFPCSGSIITLKNEVAKRIQMDVGIFDIKYLDDDNDWVKLTYDADLAECMEISLLSGRNVLRLLVTEIAAIIGSSCGSTG
jgi:hypothetical protein